MIFDERHSFVELLYHTISHLSLCCYTEYQYDWDYRLNHSRADMHCKSTTSSVIFLEHFNYGCDE